MDLRLTFNNDPEGYEKWRTKYCDELFEDIKQYSRLNEDSKVVEVGCGTGQATEQLLKTGCAIEAVELGANLAAYTEKKFADNEKFKVWNGEFEKYPYEKNSLNLVYSGTAFHWIPEEVGYSKVLDMLKPGGTIAVFWNKPFFRREDDPLHQKIRSIYLKYAEMGHIGPEPKSKEDDTERYERIANSLKKYGFKNVEQKLYKKTQSFLVEDFIALLNTYSDHVSMDAAVREGFYDEIRSAINDFGGSIKQYDTMDLYLGRKI
jgi:ubiquinone/menaquinone biosynthesis C-methylase UbiE